MSDFLEEYPLSREEQVFKMLSDLEDDQINEENVLQVLSRYVGRDTARDMLRLPFLQHFISTDWETIQEVSMFRDSRNVMAFAQYRFSRTSLHSHKYFELIYVAHGTCKNDFIGNAVRMGAGDLCVIPPACVHRLSSLGDDSLVYNVLVRTSTFQDTFTDLLTVEDELSAFFLHSLYGQKGMSPLLFQTGASLSIRQIVTDMADRLTDGSYYAKRINDNYFRLLISLVLETCAQGDSILQIYPTDKLSVLSVLRYIYKNYATASLTDAAATLGYSENYLSKLMKRETGKSFRKQLSEVRMSHAAAMMENPGVTTEQIMAQIGITDLSYYYKAFKLYTGKTPAEYRRWLREK